MKMSEPWPFDQPPNCAVVTTSGVMKDGAPITRVFHDEDDDGWQFLHEGEFSMKEAMLVSLKNVVAHDESVLQLADLPPGWCATRKSKNAKWFRIRAREGEGDDPLADYGVGNATTPTSVGGGLLKIVLGWFRRS